MEGFRTFSLARLCFKKDMDTELSKRLDRLERLALLGAKRVLTLDDLSLLTGKSKKTLYRKMNEIPHYYGGNGLAFKREEIESWLCQVKCKPVSI